MEGNEHRNSNSEGPLRRERNEDLVPSQWIRGNNRDVKVEDHDVQEPHVPYDNDWKIFGLQKPSKPNINSLKPLEKEKRLPPVSSVRPPVPDIADLEDYERLPPMLKRMSDRKYADKDVDDIHEYDVYSDEEAQLEAYANVDIDDYMQRNPHWFDMAKEDGSDFSSNDGRPSCHVVIGRPPSREGRE